MYYNVLANANLINKTILHVKQTEGRQKSTLTIC